MALKIWINDKLVDEVDAKISVFDHGVLYGDGVFEGIRVYSGRVFELEAHIKRLYESASCENAVVFVIADNIQLYPEELYEKGMKVVSSTTVRNHPLAIPPQVKSLNYLNNILAKIEALDNDVPEAIMYNHEGFVAEATGDNVFIIKNGVIYTPPVSAGSLGGITRGVVIELAKSENLEVVEKNLTRFDLYTCDEFFLTGTAAEVIGIVDIDGRVIGWFPVITSHA
jgi:branched-chain amino acid aminotransferase